jgi:T5SS/PEP-CTERM-associated repeat protein
VRASDVTWITSGGGSFQDEANWIPDLPFSSDVPDANDIAHFGLTTSSVGLETTYTVTFAADATNQRLVVEDDRVTFDLNGHTCSAASPVAVSLGTESGRLGRVAVTDGFLSTEFQADILIGAAVDGSGALLVSTGGLVLGSPEIFVGDNGAGTLSVFNGGDVIADAVIVGRSSSSSGTATITGNGSALVAANVDVGDGSLNITAGGAVESTSAVIGAFTFHDGEAIVDGPGSRWVNSNDLVVGDRGGGRLKILGGGRVSNANAFVGRRADSGFIFGVNVLVADADSTWDVNGRLGVGGDPTTGSDGVGTVAIDNGGSVVVAQDTLIYSRDTLFLAGGTLTTTEISFPTSELNVTPGTFDWSSGTLHVGIYRGDLTVPSGGVLAPGNSAGRTIVFGDYNQEAPFAQLQIEIAGSPASFQFDVLEVRGDVVLGGNLQLPLLNGFVPTAANAYSVLTPTGSLSGAFANVASGQRLATADGLGSFVVSYGPGSPFNPTFVVVSGYKPAIAGDFDFDDQVDGRDFLIWQRGGSPNANSAADFAAWRGNFGVSALTPAGVTVPEPRAQWWAASLMLFALLYQRTQRSCVNH